MLEMTALGAVSSTGDDLWHVGQDFFHALFVQLALLKSVIGFHLQSVVHNNSYICLFRQFVARWTVWLHDCQMDVFDSLLLAIVLEVLLDCVLIRKNDYDGSQLGRLPLSYFRI